MDIGHEETELIIKETEREVRKVYLQAQAEAQEKLDDYLRRYAAKDAIKREQLARHEIKMKDYAQWRKGQICIGQRWQELVNTLAQDYTNADRIAMSIVNGHMPDAYALNHNYATFQVEKDAMIDTSYTLYDRATVERLIRDNPDLLPQPRVDIPKDKRWNRTHLKNEILQGVLQGEDLRTVAKRLQSVTDMDYRAAMRNARTMMTGAQNAGRVDAYERAEGMGIVLEQEWLATLDGRTRHSHRQMDGQHVKVGEKFPNGCEYPGDPNGPPWEVYNCRCTLVPRVEGVDQSNAPRNSKLRDMTYEEWKHELDQIKTPSLREMIEADSSKYTGVQKNALLYYAEHGKFPDGLSSYQKKKLQGAVDQYSHGVQGRDVELTKTQTPSKPKLPTHDQYKVPTQTRQEADRWVKDEHIVQGYSGKQLQAMQSYMMESDDINGMLRGYSDYYDKSVVRTLSSCMSKYNHEESVYRGIDGKVLGIRGGESVDSIKQRLVGRSYRDKGFMSTSRSLDVAREFSMRGAFDEFEAETPCVLVLDIGGVNVAYLNSGLAEILLDKGSTITYTDAVIENGLLKIFGRVK